MVREIEFVMTDYEIQSKLDEKESKSAVGGAVYMLMAFMLVFVFGLLHLISNLKVRVEVLETKVSQIYK